MGQHRAQPSRGVRGAWIGLPAIALALAVIGAAATTVALSAWRADTAESESTPTRSAQ